MLTLRNLISRVVGGSAHKKLEVATRWVLDNWLQTPLGSEATL